MDKTSKSPIADRLDSIVRTERRSLKSPAFLIPSSDKVKLDQELSKSEQELLTQGEKERRQFRGIPVYSAPDGMITEYQYDEEEAIKKLLESVRD